MAKGQHNFAGKFCHWVYCSKCGLVYMKNEKSRKAATKRCDSDWEDVKNVDNVRKG